MPGVPSGLAKQLPHAPIGRIFRAGEREIRVEYRHLGNNHFIVRTDDDGRDIRVISWDSPNLTLEEDSHRWRARVSFDDDRTYVYTSRFSVSLVRKPRFPDKSLAIPAGGCVAPMPGKVIELRVAEGEAVQAGQVLLIMEAMKMEHSVTAPQDGTVTQVTVAAGDQVDADALLIVVADA